MTMIKQPDDAKHQVQCAIETLNELQTELEAEKAVAHAKGYISGLRYSQLIEHADFKSMDSALDEALRDWHWKHDKL
jgi:hypothetical protein